MQEPGKKPSLREQWASISLEQRLAMVVAPVVVFVVTTVLIPGVRDPFRDGARRRPNEADASAFAFDVGLAGATHTFDSLECATHAVAPTCAHCGCRIIGHDYRLVDRA